MTSNKFFNQNTLIYISQNIHTYIHTLQTYHRMGQETFSIFCDVPFVEEFRMHGPPKWPVLERKAKSNVSRWLLRHRDPSSNSRFSLTKDPRSKRRTSLSVYRQFTNLSYFDFYLYTAYAAHYVYFTDWPKVVFLGNRKSSRHRIRHPEQ